MDSPSSDASPFDSRAPGRALADRWAPGAELLLDGPLERRSIRSATFNFVMGLLALGGAFLLFQVVVSPILLVVQIGLSEGGASSLQTMSRRASGDRPSRSFITGRRRRPRTSPPAPTPPSSSP